ncbi:hypothetical protein DPMN_121576 [Dreissena polymorpha]|uniref:WAP domain-containing protein n=1 Tax=Dreissena polymorpha TaxID=45954 RepID=A0A9D4GMC5_DREPO|nr:hypothetical protein DPMN_121576 [Dreissena polymorpha]
MFVPLLVAVYIVHAPRIQAVAPATTAPCDPAACPIPRCLGYYTPPGVCCPICPFEKPGFCPPKWAQSEDHCHDRICSREGDCPGIEKCCSSRYRCKFCMKPLGVRPFCLYNGVEYQEGMYKYL